MKILMCHNYYKNRGGEDVAFDNEVETLKKWGYDVVLYNKNNTHIKSFSKKIKVFFGFLFSINTFKEIEIILKKEKPDIAHIHNIFSLISPSIYFALKKNKIPIIQTIHNYRFFCSNGLCLRNKKVCIRCKKLKFFNIFKICNTKKFYDFFLSITIYLLRKFSIYNNLIDYFIVPSIFVKNMLLECGFDKQKVIVKRIPLNCTNIVLPKNLDNFIKNEKYFLFIGRLSEEKGIIPLIKLFKEINKIKLKILGEGPLMAYILKFLQYNKLNNIEVYGYVEESFKNILIFNSLSVIFPSIGFETCGLVMVESLKLGTPVIVKNISALPEPIIDGYSGFIYNNLKQLEKVILKLYNMKLSDRYEMRENCQKSFLEFFNEDKNFKIIADIYEKLKNKRIPK